MGLGGKHWSKEGVHAMGLLTVQSGHVEHSCLVEVQECKAPVHYPDRLAVDKLDDQAGRAHAHSREPDNPPGAAASAEPDEVRLGKTARSCVRGYQQQA